jgi:hypothetical protein
MLRIFAGVPSHADQSAGRRRAARLGVGPYGPLGRGALRWLSACLQRGWGVGTVGPVGQCRESPPPCGVEGLLLLAVDSLVLPQAPFVVQSPSTVISRELLIVTLVRLLAVCPSSPLSNPHHAAVLAAVGVPDQAVAALSKTNSISFLLGGVLSPQWKWALPPGGHHGVSSRFLSDPEYANPVHLRGRFSSPTWSSAGSGLWWGCPCAVQAQVPSMPLNASTMCRSRLGRTRGGVSAHWRERRGQGARTRRVGGQGTLVPPGLGGAQAATNRARWAGGIDRDCVDLVRYFGSSPNARVRPRVVPTHAPSPPVPQAASCPVVPEPVARASPGAPSLGRTAQGR